MTIIEIKIDKLTEILYSTDPSTLDMLVNNPKKLPLKPRDSWFIQLFSKANKSRNPRGFIKNKKTKIFTKKTKCKHLELP